MRKKYLLRRLVIHFRVRFFKLPIALDASTASIRVMVDSAEHNEIKHFSDAVAKASNRAQADKAEHNEIKHVGL